MKTQNKVQLIGYLGIDPIIRKFPSGNVKATLRLATDKYRKDNDGNVQHIVMWHNVIAWGDIAEKIENDFIKGSHVMVQGELVHSTYEDLTGHIRFVSEIKAETLMNLDR